MGVRVGAGRAPRVKIGLGCSDISRSGIWRCKSLPVIGLPLKTERIPRFILVVSTRKTKSLFRTRLLFSLRRVRNELRGCASGTTLAVYNLKPLFAFVLFSRLRRGKCTKVTFHKASCYAPPKVWWKSAAAATAT